MNPQQEADLIATIARDQQELARIKLKDLPLESFSGEAKQWRIFKLHLTMALADLNTFSVMSMEEPFPEPANPHAPTPLETALIQYYLARDPLAKRVMMMYCKGESANIVLAGEANEPSSEIFRRLRSRYEGDERSHIATLLTQLHERRTLRKAEEMGKHLQIYLDIARELRELGSPIPIIQLKSIISRSLP